MVSYKEIQASNALISDGTAPRVAVFVGGTSGIGKHTLKALALTGTAVRIYLIGRPSSEHRSKEFIREVESINSNAEIIWVEGEVALLSDTKRVCEAIKAKESRIDLLFLSTGYAPMAGRKETSEFIEITQSLEYYSRILFVLQLLPLLQQAEAARVISVLAGGLESLSVDLDDIDLKKTGNFGMIKAQNQFGTMNTVALERLALENPSITFIHAWPGWVRTGNARRGAEPGTYTDWAVQWILEPIVNFFSYTMEESGERHLFLATSAAFGGKGVPWTGSPGLNTFEKPENGLFLVNYKGNCTPNAKVVPKLREKAAGILWSHTQEILGPFL